MKLNTDREVQHRRTDEHAARRAAEKAHGLFLRADEVASLRYHLDRVQRGIVDDWSLRGVVDRLLDNYGSGEIELRPTYPTDEGYLAGEHPYELCPRCGSQSFDFGNAYHECKSCKHAFLLVAPEN